LLKDAEIDPRMYTHYMSLLPSSQYVVCHSLPLTPSLIPRLDEIDPEVILGTDLFDPGVLIALVGVLCLGLAPRGG